MKEYWKAISVVFLVIALIALTFFHETNTYYEQYVDFGPLKDYCILLDAGHGGVDGGASGIHTNAKESDINLGVVLFLQAIFEKEGATVVLTRKNKEALCGTRKFNKQQDMAERARMIEISRPDIVVSIHCNSYPSFDVKGAQAFYYPQSEEGEKLAKAVQASIVELLDSANRRVAKEEDFFMLRNGSSVNVMVECGFLTCPEEEKLLLDEEYQKKMAYAIYDGTLKYINAKQ